MFRYIFIIVSFLLIPFSAVAQTDTDKLGMALEYFQSQKYHEALLVFEDLDSRYQLNPRFKAYMGVCYFYEWNYEKATEYLDSVLEAMQVYSPHEQAVYFFADAESHFYLQQYDQAIPLYEKMLKVCFNNEEPVTFYKLGFCYLFQDQWEPANDYFRKALDGFQKMLPTETARITQLKNMINGLHSKLPPTREQWAWLDSLWMAQNAPRMLVAPPTDLPPMKSLDIPLTTMKDTSETKETFILAEKDSTAEPQQKVYPIPSQDVGKDTISSPIIHDIDLNEIYQDVYLSDSTSKK
ncbi:MAG: tetratricopeptide repeat protein [Prevotella sp.]|jgi:tetratricopeptide (TPR) repeat protein